MKNKRVFDFLRNAKIKISSLKMLKIYEKIQFLYDFVNVLVLINVISNRSKTLLKLYFSEKRAIKR